MPYLPIHLFTSEGVDKSPAIVHNENMILQTKKMKSSIGGGAPQQPDYIWLCEGKYTCFAEPSAPVDTSEKEHNMSKKTNVTNANESISHNDLLPYSLIHLLTFVKPLRGFTMAEILLSLTIIGVVAAITLPSLMANINERTWNTQRKALYARMSQAIAMMPQVGGYGTLTEDESGSVTADTAAETFLTEGLSKVLKINNICDSEHLADCGVPSSYTNMAGSTKTWPTKLSELGTQFVNFSYVGSGWYDNGSTDATFSYSQPDTKAAAFETQNGETIALYYNPYCTADLESNWHYSQSKMCANFVYDLNGNKGPNTVGKDVGFVTALYSDNTNVVAPMPLAKNVSGGVTQLAAGAACSALDVESRLPNKDELTALYYNLELLGLSGGVDGYWSSSAASSGSVWIVNFASSLRHPLSRTSSALVRCIKR